MMTYNRAANQILCCSQDLALLQERLTHNSLITAVPSDWAQGREEISMNLIHFIIYVFRDKSCWFKR